MARRPRDPGEPHETVQVTLAGRPAWILSELKQRKGSKSGPIAAWMIERWIDSQEGRAFLMDSYKIDVTAYGGAKPDSNVVSLADRKTKT